LQKECRAKEGAKASVAARIKKADNRTSDLLSIIEELKIAGAVSLRQIASRAECQGDQDGARSRVVSGASAAGDEARGLVHPDATFSFIEKNFVIERSRQFKEVDPGLAQ
jgi:hypothetical protein